MLLCAATGCLEHTPLGPGDEVIVVHAVLNPRETVQHVVVERTSNEARRGAHVSGATVTLTAPDGTTFVGTEVKAPLDTIRYELPMPRYDVPVGNVAMGTTYHLRVVVPTGEVVEGETTMPNAVAVSSMPERRLDRRRDTLRLSWPRVPGARAYEVRVVAQSDTLIQTGENSYVYSYGQYATFADTSITLPGTFKSGSTPVFYPSSRYDVVVSAVDANYYEYYRMDSEPLSATALPTSLRGAVGVFGAFVPILRMTVVVDRDDTFF
jgi:hypothetical protein